MLGNGEGLAECRTTECGKKLKTTKTTFIQPEFLSDCNAKLQIQKREDKECPPSRSFSEVFSEVSEVLLPENPLKSSETSELSEVLKVNYLVFSKFKSREARVIQRFITPSPSHFSIGITSFPSLRGLPTESSEH